RRCTAFSERQLQELNLLFRRNPYPGPGLTKHLASRMNMHPRALQAGQAGVWFKNQRAKLRRANCPTHHPKTEIETTAEPEARAETSAQAPAGWPCAPGEGTLPGAYTMALIRTERAVPAFQLDICPPMLHAGGHRVVHFSCCQDPLVYCMHPVMDA
ncbi:Divergent paired-related homeobox, partial [Heterocephalus glaber]